MPHFRKKPVMVEAQCWVGVDDAMLAFCPQAKIDGSRLIIPTLEGDMEAGAYDWIIKGVRGEFYPCKHDIFMETYERVPAERIEPPAVCAECGERHTPACVPSGREVDG